MLNPTLTEEGGINRDTRRGVLAWVVCLAGWRVVQRNLLISLFSLPFNLLHPYFLYKSEAHLRFLLYIFLAFVERFQDQIIVTGTFNDF